MEKNSSIPYFYLNSSIPTYVGKEPLKKTILTTHQKKVLNYIHLLESENPIPILSSDHPTSQNLYFHTNYAFYADPICTGKSYVILSLLSIHQCVERKKLLTIWSNGLGMNVFSKIQNFEIPLSILVIPISSLAQWNTLFHEETDIRYFVIDSDTSIDKINTYDYDVLIVVDSVFDKVCDHFQGFSVSRIIFDDLHHLEIKDSNFKPSYVQNSSDPSLFGDLRSSFTWFISSEPQICLQKYRNSRLPFAILIKQIFSFPYAGLIFRNEDVCLEQSLSVILPEIKIDTNGVNLQKVDLTISIQSEVEDILQSNCNMIHLVSLMTQRLNLKLTDIKDLKGEISREMFQTLMERYDKFIDPITYEKIKYPILLKCCYQLFDLISISKCFVSDQRCPFCRKESNWENMTILESPNYSEINQDIWKVLQSIDPSQYNVLYIPSLSKDIVVSKRSKHKIHQFIREIVKKYKCFIFSGKSNSRKVFEDFKNEKGILILGKPIQANLHLSFVDKVFVLHPKEYKCTNEKVWYTNYFKTFYSGLLNKANSESRGEENGKENGKENGDWKGDWNDRSQISLTDHELGNFCIGRKEKLYINFMTFI